MHKILPKVQSSSLYDPTSSTNLFFIELGSNIPAK